MGFRTSGVAWLEVPFLLFPHLALPFSALHFVGKAEFIQGCPPPKPRFVHRVPGGIWFEDF